MNKICQTCKLILISLVLLHLVPLATSARAALLTPLNDVRLVDRDVIRLSDVFTHLGQARDQVIGPAPAPGQDITLNARTLMHLATAYQVSWQPQSARDQVVLRRAGVVVSPDEIVAAIKQELKNRQLDQQTEMVLSTTPTAFVLPKGADATLVVQAFDHDPIKGTFSVRLSPTDQAQMTQTIMGTIEALVAVPVTTTTLRKGDIIKQSDLDTMTVRHSQIKGERLADAADLVGRVARQTLPAGRVIKATDTEIPLSLKRGDKITLLYRLGTMELAARGRASEDGRAGDRIQVVNTDSNKTLQGTVTALYQVTID